MIVKIAITAAVLAVSFAGVLYAVTKTAIRKEEENAQLPEDEQLAPEELEDNLMGDFIQDVKSYKVVKFLDLVLQDVKKFMFTIYDYRVKAAMVIIAIGCFPIAGIPAAASGVAWSVLGQELAWQALTHGYDVWRA